MERETDNTGKILQLKTKRKEKSEENIDTLRFFCCPLCFYRVFL